jgi:hypothetical protein
LFTHESTDEAFQVYGGFVVGAAVASSFGFSHSAESPESPEALAGGAFGNTQFTDEIIERKWMEGDEKQAVDFADRAWESEDANAIDKEVDHLLLDGAEVFALGFGGGRIHAQQIGRMWDLFKFF